MMKDSNATTSVNGMTREEKDLVLHDLCARLPYGVICNTSKGSGHLCSINQTIFGTEYGINIKATERDYFNDKKEIIKPYLRPMSSMTEEEKFELKQEHVKDQQLFAEVIVVLNNTEMRGKVIPHFAADWCDKNMFDYRGLIPAGLALSTEEFNPYVED